MTNYLISFPSSALTGDEEVIRAASEASRAVVREAKAAGVWVFGGGIDETAPPLVVDPDGGISDATYPQTRRIDGGFAVLALPSRDDALAWAARLATACGCAQEVRAFADDPES